MIQVDIPAAVRTVFGKGESRRLRMDKKTPAVVYSKGEEALALQFDEDAVIHLSRKLFEQRPEQQ
ncbi:hypothetical protein VU03_05060, partial [Desulfobulbus sp. N3]|nr:hypothetical protein [Desulfobulbus sp. N3]